MDVDEEDEDGIGVPIEDKVGGDIEDDDDKDGSPRLVEDHTDDEDGPLPAVNDEAAAAAATMEEEDTDMMMTS